jgi:hypothetical protein
MKTRAVVSIGLIDPSRVPPEGVQGRIPPDARSGPATARSPGAWYSGTWSCARRACGLFLVGLARLRCVSRFMALHGDDPRLCEGGVHGTADMDSPSERRTNSDDLGGALVEHVSPTQHSQDVLRHFPRLQSGTVPTCCRWPGRTERRSARRRSDPSRSPTSRCRSRGEVRSESTARLACAARGPPGAGGSRCMG